MSTLTDTALIDALAELMTKGGFPTTPEEVGARLDESYEDAWDLDSLAHLELMVALGNRFGIAISDDDATELKTPSATLAFIARAMGGEG